MWRGSGFPRVRPGYRLRDPWWGISPVPRRLRAVAPHPLGIVHIVPEGTLYGGTVGPKTIRPYLDAPVAVGPLAQGMEEPMGCLRVSPAHNDQRDHLGLGIQGDKHGLIPKGGIRFLSFGQPLCLPGADRPEFIGLEGPGMEALHPFGEDLLTPRVPCCEMSPDRLPGHPGNALGATNAGTLHASGEDGQLFFRPERAHRPCLARAKAVCSDGLGEPPHGLRCVGGTASPDALQRFRGCLFWI